MGSGASRVLPPRPPVPQGKVRICVAGFTLSHHTGKARTVASAIAQAHPQYETWFYFDKHAPYRAFLATLKSEFAEEQQKAFASHTSSPFCWLELPNGDRDAKGGRDRLCEWVQTEFKADQALVALASVGPGLSDAWVDESPGTADLSQPAESGDKQQPDIEAEPLDEQSAPVESEPVEAAEDTPAVETETDKAVEDGEGADDEVKTDDEAKAAEEEAEPTPAEDAAIEEAEVQVEAETETVPDETREADEPAASSGPDGDAKTEPTDKTPDA